MTDSMEWTCCKWIPEPRSDPSPSSGCSYRYQNRSFKFRTDTSTRSQSHHPRQKCWGSCVSESTGMPELSWLGRRGRQSQSNSTQTSYCPKTALSWRLVRYQLYHAPPSWHGRRRPAASTFARCDGQIRGRSRIMLTIGGRIHRDLVG